MPSVHEVSPGYEPSITSGLGSVQQVNSEGHNGTGTSASHQEMLDLGPTTGIDSTRISQQIFDATLILGRNDKVASPLQPLLKRVDLTSGLFKLPVLGRLAHIEDAMHDKTLNSVPTTGGLGHMPFAKRRLLTAKLARSDDALLAAALKKLRNLILFWPEDSKLGRTLLTSAGSVVGEDILQQSIKDCFSGKAVATLVKRASDYTRFAQWMVHHGRGRPLCPKEADLYDYISMLRSSGAGATAGDSFLSAWRFMHHIVGAGGPAAADIVSGRVIGASKDLGSKKRRLRQAPPLTADSVWKLEDLMASDTTPKVRAITGFMLFCIYSCCRFGDGARAFEPTLSQFEHVILVETSCSEYKTATGERRTVLLPLVALGSGLQGSGWALSWMKARRDCGLATILSWAAKSATFGWQERLILGHHLDEETRMTVTYSRDAIASTMVKVFRMLETVRDGVFNPDASRAERIAMATGMHELAAGLPAKSDLEIELDAQLRHDREHSKLGESDIDEDEIHGEALEIPHEAKAVSRSVFPPVEQQHCVVHKLSGIVHCKETSDSLLCGRHLSVNMKPIDFPWDEREAHEFCEQCNKALYRA
eukprot:s6056_g4.t1